MRSLRLTTKMQLMLEQGVFSGTGFAINIVMLKVLGLEQYGIFASLTMVVYFLLGVVHALVVQPMQVHLTRVTEEGEYRSVLLLILGVLLLLFTAIALGLYLTDWSLLATFRPYLPPFVLYLLTFLTFDYARKFYLARGAVRLPLVMSLLYLIAVTAGVAWLLSVGVDHLPALLYVLAGGYLPPVLVAACFYGSKASIPDRNTLKHYLKIHLIEGQWLLYASVVQWLSSNLYVMTSGLLIGLEALGVLRFVQTLLGVINIFLQTIENHTLPVLSRAYSESIERCYQSFQRRLVPFQLAILGGLVLLFCLAPQILALFGRADLTSYAFVLRGMVLLYVVIILAYPLRLLIRLTELNRSYFTAYLLSFGVSLLSYHYLLSHFGVSGAVAGLIINQLILQATWLVVLNNKKFQVWRLYTS